MALFKTFSFQNANAIFGIIEIQGWAEGDDVLTIEMEEDQFSDVAGAKGDVARSQTSDNRCTITIKLLQTSITNAELTAAYTLDKTTGSGVAPMIIEDKEAGETFVVNNAWINKYPKVVRGPKANAMEWVFRGDEMTPIIT